MQKVFIATPSIDGALDARYVQSLLPALGGLRQNEITYEVAFEIGNSIISSARNNLVAEFLNSDATDLLFIDSDLSWDADALLKIISYDQPFVAGVYQTKDPVNKGFTVKFLDNIKMADGLIEVMRVGTGFMRLRRDCLEKMIEGYPDLKLVDKKNPENKYLFAFFDNQIVDGAYVGEDYTFCDRWRKIGGKVLIDPALTFSHWGLQPFDNRLMDFLK